MLPTVVGLQVTAVLAVPVTVAVNCCVCETPRSALAGPMEMPTPTWFSMATTRPPRRMYSLDGCWALAAAPGHKVRRSAGIRTAAERRAAVRAEVALAERLRLAIGMEITARLL